MSMFENPNGNPNAYRKPGFYKPYNLIIITAVFVTSMLFFVHALIKFFEPQESYLKSDNGDFQRDDFLQTIVDNTNEIAERTRHIGESLTQLTSALTPLTTPLESIPDTSLLAEQLYSLAARRSNGNRKSNDNRISNDSQYDLVTLTQQLARSSKALANNLAHSNSQLERAKSLVVETTNDIIMQDIHIITQLTNDNQESILRYKEFYGIHKSHASVDPPSNPISKFIISSAWARTWKPNSNPHYYRENSFANHGKPETGSPEMSPVLWFLVLVPILPFIVSIGCLKSQRSDIRCFGMSMITGLITYYTGGGAAVLVDRI